MGWYGICQNVFVEDHGQRIAIRMGQVATSIKDRNWFTNQTILTRLPFKCDTIQIATRNYGQSQKPAFSLNDYFSLQLYMMEESPNLFSFIGSPVSPSDKVRFPMPLLPLPFEVNGKDGTLQAVSTVRAVALLVSLLLFPALPLVANDSDAPSPLEYREIATLPSVGNQIESIGVAGAFVGVHNEVLIIAGGANFPKPYWGQAKQWHSDINILKKNNDKYSWLRGGHLNHPIAYGSSVSTSKGIVCIGGNDADQCYKEVFRLSWDPDLQELHRTELPSLPKPCAYSAATIIGSTIYVAGGTETNDLDSAMCNFWALDLREEGTDYFRWNELPTWPGQARAFCLSVSQHDGKEDKVYIFSGRNIGPDKTTQFLSDAFVFSPTAYWIANHPAPWKEIQSLPVSVMSGEAIPVGQSHIFVIGGADGTYYNVSEEIKDQHPGFPKYSWAYNTITDTWYKAGSIPVNHVTTQIAKWGDDFILASGEIRPRVRSPKIWCITPTKNTKPLDPLDYTLMATYLAVILGIGVLFTFRNKSTDDYFRGGQRVLWWAAGCSIFATMLSALTFIALPAKVYSTDWAYFLSNLFILLLAPFIIQYIMPFFRVINATSAYEYLELRFNLLSRLFAASFYILFQFGRMAIVMYLPALALTTVTPIPVEICVLTIGILSLVYCTFGGIEAVIWTDTAQTFILLGGALLSFLIIIASLNGGFGTFLATGFEDKKFSLGDMNFSSSSFGTPALWVIFLGGFAGQLTSYSSDQGIIQRYVSTATVKSAARSIWTNAILSTFATILFFSLGTALYVYYKQNPLEFDPSLQTDSVYPQFISRSLPSGISGLVIAGAFAAAQSTISTSMNSISTVFCTDLIKRFQIVKTDTRYLLTARLSTFVAGAIGILLSLILISSDINSMFDQFISVIGIFGSPVAGLFLLGMFTKKSNSIGVNIGILLSIAFVLIIYFTATVNPFLYAIIGLASSCLFGYLFSCLAPGSHKAIVGLTIHTSKDC